MLFHRYQRNALTSLDLQASFPKRFKIVRFEDFWLKPFTVTADLLRFLRVPFSFPMKEVIDTRVRGTKRADDDDGEVIISGMRANSNG